MRPAPPMLDWAEWGTAAFARAGRENRPVFLYLRAAWSAPCRRFEADLEARPAVLAWLDAHVVPVRVDADVRPDLADRYGLGGWPTLLVLTPEGDTLTGGSGVDVERLSARLPDVVLAFRTQRAELLRTAAAHRASPPWTPGEPSAGARETGPAESAASLVAWAFAHRDALLGRAVSAPREPMPQTLRALVAAGSCLADARALALAEEALVVLLASPLCASGEGMFRAAGGPGWTDPEPVFVLEPQARLLEALLEAAVRLGADEFREHACRLARFIVRDMGHPDGGFVQARHGTMAGLAGGRSKADIADRRRFVDANAAAIGALLQAAAVLDEPPLAEAAMAAFERVVPAAYQPGAGLAHVIDPQPSVRGLLGDQVAVAAASLAAAETTGATVYQDLAEEIGRAALRKHTRPGVAALADRLSTPAGAGDVGRLAVPLFPLEPNALAARVLGDLATRTGDEALLARARAILAAFAGSRRDDGPNRGAHVLAALEIGAGGKLGVSRPTHARDGGTEHA